MALIKCPECGKMVSDKAEDCPNCGFPISAMIIEQQKPLSEGLNNTLIYGEKTYDLTDVVEFVLETIQHCKPTEFVQKIYTPGKNIFHDKFPEISDEDADTIMAQVAVAGHIIEHKMRPSTYNYDKLSQPTPQPSNQVHCPKCGSTSITTEEQGYGLFGWIGASQKKNLCQKCGYKWWPGR